MLHSQHRLLSGAVRLLDLCILVVGGYTAHAIPWPPPWGGGVPPLPGELLLAESFLVCSWVLLTFRVNLYTSRRSESLFKEFVGLFEVCLLSFAFGSTLSWTILGKVVLPPLTGVLISWCGLSASRIAIRGILRFLRVRGFNFRYILLVGRGRASSVLADRIRRNPHFGLRLLGLVEFTGEKKGQVDPARYLGGIRDLKRVLAEYVVDTVVICPSNQARTGEIYEAFLACDEAGIPCHYAPSFFSLRNLRTEIVWYGDTPAFAFQPGPGAPLGMALKRGIDIVLSAMALVLLFPVMLGIAVAIWIEDRGPILFRQQRAGKNGRIFDCLKFRSMCLDAEDKLERLKNANEQDGPVFKIRRDPRVTRVGGFLRKYSLDELPQLFNVLKGDMSLVGPRPPIPAEVREYDWWQRRRLSVRPGITCIWQVWGRNKVSFSRWMEMDLYYIDNWSLWMDLKLMARTVQTVLKGTGM